MADKQELKTSEARILVFLSKTELVHHWTGRISAKLEIDYAYTCKLLYELTEKQWIKKDKSPYNPSRSYFNLTEYGKTMLPMAENMVSNFGINK